MSTTSPPAPVDLTRGVHVDAAIAVLLSSQPAGKRAKAALKHLLKIEPWAKEGTTNG